MSEPLPPPSVLAGLDPATLQTWLTQAQTALAALNSGQRVVTVTVTGGGQHREVTYRNDPNSLAMLNAWIIQLQGQLGIRGRSRRRAIGVRF